ncbi:MAG: hypothetical protein Q9218_004864 [Villophora microphyllina]
MKVPSVGSHDLQEEDGKKLFIAQLDDIEGWSHVRNAFDKLETYLGFAEALGKKQPTGQSSPFTPLFLATYLGRSLKVISDRSGILDSVQDRFKFTPGGYTVNDRRKEVKAPSIGKLVKKVKNAAGEALNKELVSGGTNYLVEWVTVANLQEAMEGWKVETNYVLLLMRPSLFARN